MEYIGDETMPAPLIRTVRLEDPRAAYEEVVASMKAIRKAKLVHGDLSEYNILWWGGHPWIIDCAQGVALEHPQAEDWFLRDCAIVAKYFGRLGVDTDADRLAETVRGG